MTAEGPNRVEARGAVDFGEKSDQRIGVGVELAPSSVGPFGDGGEERGLRAFSHDD